jgi:hypothetical protein
MPQPPLFLIQELGDMNFKQARLVSTLAAALALAACENTGRRFVQEQTDSTLSAAPQTAEVSAEAKRRVAEAKAELVRKAQRKPKAERDARTTAWQLARAAPSTEGTFGEPQSAQTHFMSKRLPEGVSTISPAMYTAALRQAADMPVFSTRQGRQLAATGGSASVVSPSSTAAQALSGDVVALVGSTGALAAAWEAMGPGNIGGRTRALLIHPTTPDTMWAGAVAGGIWKTTNGGATWVPKADLLVNMAVNSMVMDPRNPNILFAGTGEGFFNGDAVRGAGILKSTDGGETWAQLPSTANASFHYVQKLIVSKANGARMYAATRAGILRTLDGGNTWTQMINGAPVNGCMDLAIQTDRALPYVFASCGTFTQATVYRALDTSGAQTWTPVMSVPNQGRTTLAIAPSSQNVIYAMAACDGAACGNYWDGLLGVYRSTTSGSAGSFVPRATNTSPTLLNRVLLSNPVFALLSQCGFGISQFFNQGWYDNTLAVDPKNPDIVWAGGIDLFRSDDGGANFGQASHWWFGRGTDPEYNHADHHLIVFHPQYDGVTNKTMFSMNDGGIFKTADARAPVSYSPDPVTPASPVCGNTPPGVVAWTELNNGYQVTQFYHGTHYASGNNVLGGTQDNGTLRGTAGAPNAWTEIRGGDGGYVAVNPANTNMLWVENTGLSIVRSLNGGATFGAFTSGITETSGNFLFITPFAQDPSNASNMWIAGASPWRTTQATAVPIAGSVWTRAGAFLGQRIGAIAVAPSDSTRVYMGGGTGGGADNGRVFTTSNALTANSTTAWTFSKPRADSNFVSWLAVHPTNPAIVYATVSTFNSATGTGHVFKSTDFGATWTNIDGAGATGIPDVPVHCIVIDPNDTDRLYVGTDIGVFVSLEGGANWARENTGFANVIVEAMSLKNDAPRYLYAYTHGRSAYRVPLP